MSRVTGYYYITVMGDSDLIIYEGNFDEIQTSTYSNAAACPPRKDDAIGMCQRWNANGDGCYYHSINREDVETVRQMMIKYANKVRGYPF